MEKLADLMKTVSGGLPRAGLVDLVKIASSGISLISKSIPMVTKLLPTVISLIPKLIPTILTTSSMLIASITENKKMMEGIDLIFDGLTKIVGGGIT